MRVKKGQPNYLYELKKYDKVNCAFEWGIVVLLFILGYSLFGSFLNILSIVTIIGTYFPIRDTIEYIKKLPFNPMSNEKKRSLMEINDHIHILYSPLLECRKQTIGIEAIVVSGTTVLVHISNPKTNVKFAEKFLTVVLQRRVDNLNIKFYNDFKSFYDRAEGLYNMASISKNEISHEEKRIIGTIFKYYI